MDALSALSVASTIITFVDFGSKLLSNTRKLYRSKDGALSSIVDTEVVTDFRRKLPENRRLGQQYSLGGDDDDDDEALDNMCVRCVALAEELAKRLNKLKLSAAPPDGKKPVVASPESASNSMASSTTIRAQVLFGGQGSKADERAKAPAFRKWESFRKALEAIWSRREIEEMAATLRDLRDEMEFRILVSFRYSDASIFLEQSTQRIIDAFLTSRDSFAGQLKVQSERLIQIQESLASKPVTNVQKLAGLTGGQVDATGSFASALAGTDRHRCAAEDRSGTEMAMEEKMCMLMTENEILGSLSFSSMVTRRESIEAAHPQTLRWAHEEPGSTKRPGHNLVAWLRHGHGIYWVNGKLGSGKSTLMKYLFEHGKTRDELASWSQDRPVDTSGFFFWDSGDEDQRSQSGLLRSLLLQIFHRHRDMLEQVLPETWTAHYTRARTLLSKRNLSPDSPLLPSKPPNLTLSQLKQAFRDMVVSLQRKFNLCFFIDGLDEYAGDYLEITEFFLRHAALPGVKFCISSRPLPVFEQAFRDLPGLRLQDLSKQDIKEYVSSHLYNHRHMKQLIRRNPDEASRLVSGIVHKARGVFLWVKLVTRSLLRGLSDYNRLSDLKKRVSYLPSDLEALYKHVLDCVDPFYRTQMSQIFQVYRAAQSGSPGLVTLLNLSWADEEEDLLVETSPIQPYTEEEIAERCETMDARLKSVCAGLLETTNPRFSSFKPDCRVLYLHRTVSDWLAKPDVWSSLTSTTMGLGFSPNLAMLKSRIMRLKTLDPAHHGRLDLRIVVDALNYAREAENDLHCGFPKLLDQLDIATEYHWRNTKTVAPYLQADSQLSCSSSRSSSSNDSWHSLPDDESEAGDISLVNSEVVRSNWKAIPKPINTPAYLEDIEGEDFEELDRQRPHWSQAIEVPPGGKTLGGRSTFFDLARAFGLTHYVDMKYDAGHVAVEHEVNHWLLMQAFSATCGLTSMNKPKEPNLDLVRRILASGIDPNMSFDGGMTPWQGAILDAFWHLARRPGPPDDPRVWRQKAQTWAQILEAFLQHGSDPACPAVRHRRLPGYPRVTPMALVEVYSIHSLTEEAERLEACITSAVARRARPKHKLVTPTVGGPGEALSSTMMGQRDPTNGPPDRILQPRGIIQWLFF
ncbi:hypothetical protein PG994_009880 [Apiospora phragmitis]|uniref:NACHT domain-containing protein n=1 Tax=Apiospora phragmitis TaxID=2905665 RepID=A0ABR1TNB1_9PEZI